MSKSAYIKVFTRSGDFITILKDFEFNSFSSKINGGLGELQFKLARKFDDFDENYIIKFNNYIELWVIDKEQPDGICMYSGLITSYRPTIKGNENSVSVSALGCWSKVARTILRSGNYIEIKTDSSFGVIAKEGNASASYVNNVVQSIVDLYRSNVTNPIMNYSASSIGSTSNQITYTFTNKYVSEAIEQARLSAPANWWYFMGADNVLYFKSKPITATHKFIFGRHFESIEIEKTIEEVANNVIVTSKNSVTEIAKLYNDATSEDLYDDLWEIKSDNRVQIENTADNIGASILAEKKDPKVNATVTIIDNNEKDSGYDIESIKIGDTCSFYGFEDVTAKTFIDSNGNLLVLQIVGIKYSLDSVQLELESIRPTIASSIANNDENISNIQSTGVARELGTAIIGWQSPTLQNSWSQVAGYSIVGYYKDSLGFVHLMGTIQNGTTGSEIFTLPAGFRPLNYTYFPAVANSLPGVVLISSSGVVRAMVGSNVSFSLDGIIFVAEQ